MREGIALAITVLACACASATPAFPGAEGFGTDTPGGRGGRVLFVTNLNDSGPGSLRAAIAKPGRRTVLFRVAGTITLQSALEIKNPFITIAGQSAPGGIQIRNDSKGSRARDGFPTLRILTHDVVLRYLRIRPGMPELDRSCATRPRRGKEDRCYRPEGIDGVQLDALRRGKTRIKQGPRNVVLDHCSIAWATDEMIGAGSAYDLTVQWSLVSEGLDYMHYGGAKSRNGKGMLIGNEFYAKRGDVIGHASIHHNLWAHNSIRSPQATNYCPDPTQPEDCVVDLVNNYVYDWKRMGMHIANSHGASFANVVGNLFRAGPSTHKKSMGLGMRDWTSTSTGLNPGSRIEIHQEDNQDLVRGDKTRPARTECYELGGAKNGRQKVLGACDMASYAAERFDAPAVTTWPARELPERLLDSVGATQHLDAEGRWVPARDAADARVIEQVRRGWGKVLSKPADWKGWPRMPANPPPRDADDDGMPDAWEILHGLDPAKASDTLDRDGDVYTDLEEFLNGTDPNVAEAG